MNRDLLYSLGLALAAWPPVFGQAPELEPEYPHAIHAASIGSEPLNETPTPAILIEDGDAIGARRTEAR